MAQGQTVKGKTAAGQNVELLVDDTGRLFLAPASIGGAGYRQDADTPYAADGEPHPFLFNELGRLKTAGAAAQFTPVDMAVSAIQAAANTPVANATAFANVNQVSNVMAYVTGTFAGMNCTFEGSLDSTNGTDGTWFTIQAVRTNANTIETATGALSAAPIYAWEMSVNALAWFRVRCTARTSGTQNWKFRLGSYATEPIPASQASATQPVSGTVTATVTPPAPATPYFLNSAATTNGALILTGTSALQSFYATNEGATPAFVKLYNKATAPVVGTDVPEMTIPIPAAANGIPGVANPFVAFIGFRFALGLGIAITGAAAHTDTTAVAAGQVKVKLSRTV